MQIADNGVLGRLGLVLVQLFTGKVARAGDGQAEPAVQAPGHVRNLECLIGAAEDQRQAVIGVQGAAEIGEALELAGLVMQRIGAAVRRLDAQAVLLVGGRYEHIRAAHIAAVVHAGFDIAMAAAIDRDGPARLAAGLGLDVDNPCRAQAVFRRQGAGDQLHAGGQARAEGLTEHAEAFGQDHPVQAELQAVVLAADMELAVGILHRPRGLQDHLVEGGVLAAGHGLDGLGRDGVGRGADLGLNGIARLIQALGGDDHFGGRRGALLRPRQGRRPAGQAQHDEGTSAKQHDQLYCYFITVIAVTV